MCTYDVPMLMLEGAVVSRRLEGRFADKEPLTGYELYAPVDRSSTSSLSPVQLPSRHASRPPNTPKSRPAALRSLFMTFLIAASLSSVNESARDMMGNRLAL